MKKIIIILLAVLSIVMVYNNFNKSENVKIPDSAIRFRVLANSNSPRDQKIKEDVRDKMQKDSQCVLRTRKVHWLHHVSNVTTKCVASVDELPSSVALHLLTSNSKGRCFIFTFTTHPLTHFKTTASNPACVPNLPPCPVTLTLTLVSSLLARTT